jgi:hypothetical protein
MTVGHHESVRFVTQNAARYPHLDPDFILQVCFEHPKRFDQSFPGFDADKHAAIRANRSVQWVHDNVRYDNNTQIDFWYTQFDQCLATGKTQSKVLTHMVTNGNWPFPPVIIEASFAETIGGSKNLGTPYHLVEGTHRVSYMRRMLQRGMVQSEALVEVIELTPNPSLNTDAPSARRLA